MREKGEEALNNLHQFMLELGFEHLDNETARAVLNYRYGLYKFELELTGDNLNILVYLGDPTDIGPWGDNCVGNYNLKFDKQTTLEELLENWWEAIVDGISKTEERVKSFQRMEAMERDFLDNFTMLMPDLEEE
tara:strand:+ start:20480 stop:20881 length:402 start_codon:yes stop_codon:yes gene_type:complete